MEKQNEGVAGRAKNSQAHKGAIPTHPPREDATGETYKFNMYTSQIRIIIRWLLRLLIPSRSYRPMSKGPKDCDGSSSCSSWKTFQFPRRLTARYPKDPRVRKME